MPKQKVLMRTKLFWPEGSGGELATYLIAKDMLFEAGNAKELVERMESVLAMSREQIKDVGFSLREAMLKRFDPKTIKRDLMRVFS